MIHGRPYNPPPRNCGDATCSTCPLCENCWCYCSCLRPAIDDPPNEEE